MDSELLTGRSILVVEDDPLIRLEVTTRLREAGATVLAASYLENALRLADHPHLSAGVLDFDLGQADSSAVCWRLVDRGIPFLFHTGRAYSSFRQWPRAPIVLKTSAHALIGAVADLLR